jgi:hypothetical protein
VKKQGMQNEVKSMIIKIRCTDILAVVESNPEFQGGAGSVSQPTARSKQYKPVYGTRRHLR